MTSPFDSTDRQFVVLCNDDGHCSLWPDGFDTPTGWRPLFGPASRRACLEYIEEVWTDLRPTSLAEQLDRPAAG